MLTKTTYLTYTQCPKAFWLAEYQPHHLAAPPDPAVQRRLRAGQEVDRLAREQFPGGILIPYRPRPEDMTPLTAQAIAEGAKTLFQATTLLDVQNGTQAQVVWEAVIGEGETAVKGQMVEQLRAYCHLDTLAMVKIHSALLAL